MILIPGFDKVLGFFSDSHSRDIYLIVEHGGCRKITPHMWRRYEAHIANYQKVPTINEEI